MTDRTERPPSAFRLGLEQQKKRAKELLRAVKAGDAEALSRFAAARGGSVTSDSPDEPPLTANLAAAQFVIARELRFSSWAKLKAHIRSMNQERAAIDEQKPAPDADLKTLHIRCGHDIQERIAEAFVGDFCPYVLPFCVGPVSKGPDRHELMARFIADSFPKEDGSRTYESELEGLRAGGTPVASMIVLAAPDPSRAIERSTMTLPAYFPLATWSVSPGLAALIAL